jgi:hypothetical protein
MSSSTWSIESTDEWIASVSIVFAPESAKAMNFAAAMPRFPASAAKTTLLEASGILLYGRSGRRAGRPRAVAPASDRQVGTP